MNGKSRQPKREKRTSPEGRTARATGPQVLSGPPRGTRGRTVSKRPVPVEKTPASLPLSRVLRVSAWTMMILVSVGMCWKGVEVLKQSTWFAVDRIVVEGGHRLASEEIQSLAGVSRGENLITLDSREVSRRLLTHPWIRQVSVVKRFPRELYIKIAERIPVAQVRIQGDLYDLDREGFLFHKVDPRSPQALPIIEGLEEYPWRLGSREDGRAVQRALALVKVMGNSPMLGGLTRIHVDPREGLAFYLDGLTMPVKIGWDNYSDRRNKLEAVIEALASESTAIAAVDLRFSGQVILKKDMGTTETEGTLDAAPDRVASRSFGFFPE